VLKVNLFKVFEM